MHMSLTGSLKWTVLEHSQGPLLSEKKAVVPQPVSFVHVV